METIKWVVTPPCRLCEAPAEYMRRYPCIGCEKLHKKEAKAITFANHKLAKAERLRRNARIFALHENGLSYERIAIKLKLPRATVQSAAAAGRHEAEKNKLFCRKGYGCDK